MEKLHKLHILFPILNGLYLATICLVAGLMTMTFLLQLFSLSYLSCKTNVRVLQTRGVTMLTKPAKSAFLSFTVLDLDVSSTWSHFGKTIFPASFYSFKTVVVYISQTLLWRRDHQSCKNCLHCIICLSDKGNFYEKSTRVYFECDITVYTGCPVIMWSNFTRSFFKSK